MPRVDVVIVAYRSRSQLRDCIQPLLAGGDANVIVVDNASPEHDLEAVADLPVTTISNQRNGGFAYGCNTGWRAGQAAYVLFLNPDARIEPAAVERLADTLERDRGVGAVGPRIIRSDGTLDHSIRRFPTLRSTFAQALFVHRLAPTSAWADQVDRDPEHYETGRDADWLSGACLMVRRDVLAGIEGLDEGFFLYCEDNDLCRRIRALGLRVRFNPLAVSVHEGGASGVRAGLLPVLAASRVRYARKHDSRLGAGLQRLGIALGELTHAIAGRKGRKNRAGHAKALRAVLLGPPPEGR